MVQAIKMPLPGIDKGLFPCARRRASETRRRNSGTWKEFSAVDCRLPVTLDNCATRSRFGRGLRRVLGVVGGL